uniref:(northern house mosquito) hypothetical protein n=1 Tax=Culex pipiens TaxID=7175 RepID=A0A8D8EZL1_CULPI
MKDCVGYDVCCCGITSVLDALFYLRVNRRVLPAGDDHPQEESEVSWRMLNNDGVVDQVALEEVATEVATNAGWELCHVQKMLDPVEARRNPVSNLSGILE